MISKAYSRIPPEPLGYKMTTLPANGVPLNELNVPLGSGPPTREELLVYYPAKFTWPQLKTFVDSGDLGLLKRDKALQKRYDLWAGGIKAQYGSMVDYLMNHRLRWGQRDTLSLLNSAIVDADETPGDALESQSSYPPYFCWETPRCLVSIIQNDWPYSVPPEIEHTLVWTKLPIYHPDLVDRSVEARIHQDGLWGFTGCDGSPPPSSDLQSFLPALAEWGITKEAMIKSDPPTKQEALLIEKAGNEVHRFVKNRWPECDWETAWFVNPPRLQSVPGLAHIHVFARQKKA